ncbi:MAG: hypothetical protein E6Z81_00185 [Schaalia odontolytica]|nr:hypothetical protein [Schaalia odontolytica]MDU5760786.1 hypothetical protein [Schaalia odontolytica]
MEAPDSTRENGASAHEPPGVNRLSLVCGISTWVIVAITFFALYLIYDGILSFMNVDHSWDLI